MAKRKNKLGFNEECVAIACVARKGGVGKTTSAISLAYVYSQLGAKVLLIDMDSQQSASNLLGINRVLKDDPFINPKNFRTKSKECKEWIANNEIYDVDDLFGGMRLIEEWKSDCRGLHDLLDIVVRGEVVSEEDLKKAIVRPTYQVKGDTPKDSPLDLSELDKKVGVLKEFGFDLLASSEEITDDELDISMRDDIEEKTLLLKKIITRIKELRDYDVILIDCGPSLGIMSLNGMAGSDASIVFTFPDEQSILSLGKIKANYRRFIALGMDNKGIAGVALSSVQRNTNVAPVVEYKIKKVLQMYFFQNTISRSVQAQKANSEGITFPQADKNAFNEYVALGKEIVERYNAVSKWNAVRKGLIGDRIKEILNSDISNEIRKEAENELIKYVQDADQSKEDYTRDEWNSYIEFFFDRKLKEYIRKEYDEGKLWKAPRSDGRIGA